MSRTYLRAAGLTAMGFLAAGLSQECKARALFDSAAVPQKHFAVLAQPIGRAQWKLLVLDRSKPNRAAGGHARTDWWSPA